MRIRFYSPDQLVPTSRVATGSGCPPRYVCMRACALLRLDPSEYKYSYAVQDIIPGTTAVIDRDKRYQRNLEI